MNTLNWPLIAIVVACATLAVWWRRFDDWRETVKAKSTTKP